MQNSDQKKVVSLLVSLLVECDYLAAEGFCYFIEKRVVADLRFCLEDCIHAAAETCDILYDLSDFTAVLIEEFTGLA